MGFLLHDRAIGVVVALEWIGCEIDGSQPKHYSRHPHEKTILCCIYFASCLSVCRVLRKDGGYLSGKVFFIKRYPSFQIEFENIFAYESDDKALPELSGLEKRKVVAYCKYRLGLATTLTTQDELDKCKAR